MFQRILALMHYVLNSITGKMHKLSAVSSRTLKKLNQRYFELGKYDGYSRESNCASGCILRNALPPSGGLKASFSVILADPITVTRGIS